MPFINIEIKARCFDPDLIRTYLLTHQAEFKGIDHQTDTYFQVKNGRLKLREGNIENNLIFYERENMAGPKSSHFNLVKILDVNGLKGVLEKSLGIKIIVRKVREIFYIDNVKFHIDEVPGLGSFVEIEAGNIIGNRNQEELRLQCDFYLEAFQIRQEDLVEISYSDMMMEKEEGKEA
jgi:predicted adenylyl cyclase CyaB